MEDIHELGTGSSSCTTELERLAEAAASMGYSESLGATTTVTPLTLPLILCSESLTQVSSQTPLQNARHYTNDTVFRSPEPNLHNSDLNLQPVNTQTRSLSTITSPPAHMQSLVHCNEDRNIQVIKPEQVTYIKNSVEVQSVDLKPSRTLSTVIQCSPPQGTVMHLKADSKYAVQDTETSAVSQDTELAKQPESKKRKKSSYSGSKYKDFIGGLENNLFKKGLKDEVEVGNPRNGFEISSGRSMWPCETCGQQFASLQIWKLHQMDHSLAKQRNGLSLEVKIEIIKRINAGEKQGDMAEEYGLNRSTIKSIMKQSNRYMSCWKKGMFHPDSKRLKGPKREDIEAVLHAWYTQATSTGTPVSGPILCAKALDFAEKLGHADFKATHGWLDRFKKRKNIIFGRTHHRKKRDDKEGNGNSEVRLGDWQAAILPQFLLEYEPGDIFAVEETGLLYKVLPDIAFSLKGERCPGGIRSRQRITVLLCANMTGTEKFPLLVIGRHDKPASFQNVKSLPVQYVSNCHAWMTSDSFGAWLQDIDSWFIQQARRVVILGSSLPVHEKPPGSLKSVKLVTCPIGYKGPLHHGVVAALKQQYRRGILEMLVTNLEREENGKNSPSDRYDLSLLSCLQSLANAWHNVNEGCINASFTRAGISKFSAWGAPHPAEDPVICSENLTLLHRLRSLGHNVSDITFDDFVHFDDDIQVCNLMNDDDILASITGASEEDNDSRNDCEERGEDEIDGDEGIDISTEKDAPPTMRDVQAALDVVRRHILHQEDAQEMFRALAHLELLIFKGHSGKIVGTFHPNTQNSH
ncbi:unnamed protein product, partial [Meganyctiphanes norvegica]|uniref:Tigger transposable element-derived protein 4 n=1 Tax=Meganyctiphanes norvegica TaxID=48144 RepID=A0AAV2Q7B4_MEGNR